MSNLKLYDPPKIEPKCYYKYAYRAIGYEYMNDYVWKRVIKIHLIFNFLVHIKTFGEQALKQFGKIF